MVFPNMSVLCIGSFFYLHSDCGDEVSHLGKTTDEDKDVSIPMKVLGEIGPT